MIEITKDMQDRLIEAAKKAQLRAYAPYSNFRVGAAILLEDGSIEIGCNVENASYGLTICAERVAATRAIADGKLKFVAVAVVAPGEEPKSPCGACRQFLAEFNGEMPIISTGDSQKVKITSLSELLPDQFNKTSLE